MAYRRGGFQLQLLRVQDLRVRRDFIAIGLHSLLVVFKMLLTGLWRVFEGPWNTGVPQGSRVWGQSILSFVELSIQCLGWGLGFRYFRV